MRKLSKKEKELINTISSDNMTLFEKAIYDQNKELLSLYLEKMPEQIQKEYRHIKKLISTNINNDFSMVMKFIEFGFPLQDENGASNLLFEASRKGSIFLYNELRKKGLEEIQMKNGNTCLLTALRMHEFEFAKHLINTGGKISQDPITDNLYDYKKDPDPLNYVSHEIFEKYNQLKEIQKPDQYKFDKFKIIADESYDYNLMELIKIYNKLIELKVDIEIYNKDGYNSFLYIFDSAPLQYINDVYEHYDKKISLSKKIMQFNTPPNLSFLSLSIDRNNPDKFDWILKNEPDAVMTNQTRIPVIEKAVKNYLRLNIGDKIDKEIALHYVKEIFKHGGLCNMSHRPVIENIFENIKTPDDPILNVLKNYASDFIIDKESPGISSIVPLSGSNINALKWLVKEKADFNLKDLSGNSILHKIMDSRKDLKEKFDLVLNHTNYELYNNTNVKGDSVLDKIEILWLNDEFEEECDYMKNVLLTREKEIILNSLNNENKKEKKNKKRL